MLLVNRGTAPSSIPPRGALLLRRLLGTNTANSSRGAVVVVPTQMKRRYKSSIPVHAEAIKTSTTTTTTTTEVPSRQQLRNLFYSSAIPMIGFGIVDQTVMLQAGNAIDCTLGVTFGLSTLTAAAFGQVCSDASGVLFGGTLDRFTARLGLPQPNLTTAQRALPVTGRVQLLGSFCGIVLGCSLGLLNLLFIDTNRSSTLKLQAFNEEQEFEFQIEASNAVRPDATALRVTGPDVDGLLASMTAALAVRNCSLVELHAQRKPSQSNNNNDDNVDETLTTTAESSRDDDEADTDSSNTNGTTKKNATPMQMIEDVFYVVHRETGQRFPDEDLEELARSLLDAARTPMNVNSVKAAMHELERTNTFLQARVRKLEQVVYAKQITVVPASGRVVEEAPTV
jgi:Transmembrane protein 65